MFVWIRKANKANLVIPQQLIIKLLLPKKQQARWQRPEPGQVLFLSKEELLCQ